MEKNPSQEVKKVSSARYLETAEAQDFSKYESKGEVLTAYKHFVMEKIDSIRDYIMFEDDYEDADVLPNFFSLHMVEIPQLVMPAIRTSQAFIHPDEHLTQILYKLKWDGARASSQLYFSTLRKQCIDNQIQICDDPIKSLSNFKINCLKEFMEKNIEAFDCAYWKNRTFMVLMTMEKIVRTSIQLLDLFFQKWPPISPKLSKVEKKKLGGIMKSRALAKRKSTSLEPKQKDSNLLGFDLGMEMKRSTSKKQVKICPKSFKEIPTICLKREFPRETGRVKSYKDIPAKVQTRQRSVSKARTGGNSTTSLKKIDSKASLKKNDSKKGTPKIPSKKILSKNASQTSLDRL